MQAAMCLAFLLFAWGALAQQPAAIDWQRRVIRATAVGAPDLDAPSIAVARSAATRAALAAAQRNALAILESATLDDGSRVATLFEADGSLRVRVEGKLRSVRPVKTHYFTDGGVSLDIEVPFALLPSEIAEHMHPPGTDQPPAGTAPGPAPPDSNQPGPAAVPDRPPEDAHSRTSAADGGVQKAR